MRLDEHGFALVPTRTREEMLSALAETLFTAGEAGTRCLLDDPQVRLVAVQLREELVAAGLLSAKAVAVQAIAFDKTAETNWKVVWHQDVMFPFAARTTSAGFAMPCVKDGVDYARPPREVLEALTAVRLHLDDCADTNGPLRVSPGSHREGIIRSEAIPERLKQLGEVTCLAQKGEALLMKVLTLHASSPATAPKHRRVLHFVYYDGASLPEKWHREV